MISGLGCAPPPDLAFFKKNVLACPHPNRCRRVTARLFLAQIEIRPTQTHRWDPFCTSDCPSTPGQYPSTVSSLPRTPLWLAPKTTSQHCTGMRWVQSGTGFAFSGVGFPFAQQHFPHRPPTLASFSQISCSQAKNFGLAHFFRLHGNPPDGDCGPTAHARTLAPTHRARWIASRSLSFNFDVRLPDLGFFSKFSACMGAPRPLLLYPKWLVRCGLWGHGAPEGTRPDPLAALDRLPHFFFPLRCVRSGLVFFFKNFGLRVDRVLIKSRKRTIRMLK